jgi:hypothetical protein
MTTPNPATSAASVSDLSTNVQFGHREYQMTALSPADLMGLRAELFSVASIRRTEPLSDRQAHCLVKIVHASIVKNHPRIEFADVATFIAANIDGAMSAALVTS